MRQPAVNPPEQRDDLDVVRRGVQEELDRNLLAIPQLPEVAVRVVGNGTTNSANAHLLAEIIASDASLRLYVLRVAASAANRPVSPIITLQHAVAWLGFDEVANIAFTLALQGKLLHVKGEQRKARRLWRHALASALWSRQLAHLLRRETGPSYLCGLLHDIGRVVALGIVHDAADRAGRTLDAEEHNQLIELFHSDIGFRVVNAWQLPPLVPFVLSGWQDYARAAQARWECNVVHLAHKLADFTLQEPGMLTRQELPMHQAYRDLGLASQDAEPLFDSGDSIVGELDRYLAP
jgi:HD-like signal output (HDOD) protein